MTLEVYCTGRHSEPHAAEPVAGIMGLKCTVFECPLCKYDVHVDLELEDELDVAGQPVELHRLAQIVTARNA